MILNLKNNTLLLLGSSLVLLTSLSLYDVKADENLDLAIEEVFSDEEGSNSNDLASDKSLQLGNKKEIGGDELEIEEISIEEEEKTPGFDGVNKNTLFKRYDSFFYTAKEMNLFYENLAKHNQNQEVSIEIKSTGVFDFQDKETDDKKTSKDEIFIAPTFYLSSLILPSNDKFTFWMNDTKYREEEMDSVLISDFKFVNIDDSSITLTWSSINLDKIAPNYTQKLNEIPIGSREIDKKGNNWNYTSKSGHILVDSFGGVVRFTIGQNQTFSVYDMQIVEGYKEPVKIVNGNVESISGNEKANSNELRLE